MRSLNSFLFLSLSASLLIVACAKAGSSSSSGTHAARAGLAATPASAASLNGTVSASPGTQTQFQQLVTGFLSTDVNPSYVGPVNPVPTTGSGVYFGGQVSLSSGTLRAAISSGNQVTIASGKLAVQVYDSLSSNVPTIPQVALSGATGYIQGTAVVLQFTDQYGTVTMQGTLNATTNNFTGTFSYDNNVMYDGSTPGATGTLGTFTVPMCNFFSC